MPGAHLTGRTSLKCGETAAQESVGIRGAAFSHGKSEACSTTIALVQPTRALATPSAHVPDSKAYWPRYEQTYENLVNMSLTCSKSIVEVVFSMYSILLPRESLGVMTKSPGHLYQILCVLQMTSTNMKECRKEVQPTRSAVSLGLYMLERTVPPLIPTCHPQARTRSGLGSIL